MDWTTPLRTQQEDFIERLKSGDLLHCETIGRHSELTVISGERLRQLRDFCWEMAEKFKQMSNVRDAFLNNLKGKLGEEVVKARLGDLVTEVDYEQRIGGDGKIDFTLTSNPEIGIQVKARCGQFDKVRWSISAEEVEKNAVLVCVLIQEEVSEAQAEYHLILVGFLPTSEIKVKNNSVSFGINDLLYDGGLKSNFIIKTDLIKSLIRQSYGVFIALPELQSLNDKTLEENQDFSVNLEAKSKAYIYLHLGLSDYKDGNYQRAVEDFNEAIRLAPEIAEAYHWRGIARAELEDYQGAIEDYNQAIFLIPRQANKYYINRGYARYKLRDRQGAIDDYWRARTLNLNL